MNTAGMALRNAQCRKVVRDLLASASNIERMKWDAKDNMPTDEALEDRLFDLLSSSPTVPLNLNHLILVSLLGKALAWKANSITYKAESGSYTAFFYRDSPKWISWLIPRYPWGGTKAYISTLRTTIDLNQDEEA